MDEEENHKELLHFDNRIETSFQVVHVPVHLNRIYSSQFSVQSDMCHIQNEYEKIKIFQSSFENNSNVGS